jgi:HPt (histidine-containing phosphotransfer) domain-containing protein
MIMENPSATPSQRAAVEAAANAPSPADAPVFDAATLLGYLAGDRELAGFVVEAAIASIPELFDELDDALAVGEWGDARRATHTLKGLAAQLGAKKLWWQLKDADDCLRGGGKIEIELVADLRREYGLLAAALQEWS